MRVLTQEEFDLLDNVSGAFWDEEPPMEEIIVTARRPRNNWPPPLPRIRSLQFLVAALSHHQEQMTPEAPCDDPVKPISDGASEGDLIDDETGHDINKWNYVLEDRVTREMFEDFVTALRAEYPSAVVVISGGDRYVDGNVVRSSTNDGIVNGAAMKGGHNLGLAVDFVVNGAELDRSHGGVVDRIAERVGFIEFKGDYDDGHFHVSRPYPGMDNDHYLEPDDRTENPECHSS